MKSFAGMLGILALIVAFLIGGLAAVGTLSDAATSTGTGGSMVKTKTAEGKSTMVRIDKSVKAGDLSWHLSEARLTHVLRTYTYPRSSTSGDFLVMTFTIKNTSDGPITLSDEDMDLRDKETGIVGGPAASANGEYVPPTKDLLFSEESLLEPGEKREGRINFDLSIPFGKKLPPGLKGFELTLGDGDPTVKEEKRVNLGR